MPFITGSRLKAERAGVHLEELERKAAAFIDENPYEFSRQLNPKNVNNYIYEFPPQPAPPLALSVIVGDIAHNLLSALDHIAWQLALLKADKPYKYTAFPIIDGTDAASVKYFNRLTQDILPDAIRVVEAVQPYHRGDAAKYTELSILHSLWIADKHKLLTTVPVRLTVPVFSGWGGRIEELKDGTRRMEVPRSAEPEKNLEPHITREILFEIPELRERIPLHLLRRVHHVVAYEIVPFFSRFLPESGDRVERVEGLVEREH
jgi:hypothetical protein